MRKAQFTEQTDDCDSICPYCGDRFQVEAAWWDCCVGNAAAAEHMLRALTQDEAGHESVEQNRKAFILDFLRDEVRMVKTERQAEVIAGNIVKEALWQGEWSAFRSSGSCNNMSGDDTYMELLKEI